MSNQIDEKDDIDEQKSNSKNQYSIYEYFYERPTVFIAFITAVLSVLSFALSLLIVAFRNQYLSYWGFDEYQTGITIRFSVFSILFVFELFFSFFNYLISTSTDALIRNAFFFIKFRKEQEAMRKEILLTKKLIDTTIAEPDEELLMRKKEVEGLLSRIKKSKRNLLVLFLSSSVKEFMSTMFISTFLMWSSMVLVVKLLPIYTEFKSFVLIVLLCAVLYHLTILVLESITYYALHRSELKKDDDDNKSEGFIDSYKQFPFVHLRDYQLRDYLKNTNIKAFVRTCIVSLVVVIVVFVLLSEVGIKEQRTFMVADMNGNQSVVLFKDSSLCYGNRVLIEDDVAYISKNEHEIIRNENYSFTGYSFERVERVDYLKDCFIASDSTEENTAN